MYAQRQTHTRAPIVRLTSAPAHETQSQREGEGRALIGREGESEAAGWGGPG